MVRGVARMMAGRVVRFLGRGLQTAAYEMSGRATLGQLREPKNLRESNSAAYKRALKVESQTGSWIYGNVYGDGSSADVDLQNAALRGDFVPGVFVGNRLSRGLSRPKEL